MYRLMIIDDEPVVREGIKQLISWEKYNFEICAEGIDGKDGLRKVLEFSPDLVLVDVKMPGMSGIELIRDAKKEGFEGKFIILTGYSDFEFARSAVSLGVRAYLLKPIDEEELMENIQEVREELDAKKNLDDYYTLSELMARREVLNRLLMHAEDKETLRKEIKLYGMDFNYHSFCIAILNRKEFYIDANDPLVTKEMEGMIGKNLMNVDKITIDDKLILICKGSSYQNILKTLIRNNDRIKQRYGEGYFIAIGHDVANWEDICFSYECARLLLEYEFLYKELDAVSIDILNQINPKKGDKFYDKLCDMIEIGDTEAIEEIIQNLKNTYKNELMKESEIKILVIHNLVLLHSVIDHKYESKKDSFPNLDQLLVGIKEADNLDHLMEMVLNYCIETTKCIGVSTSDAVVKRMLAYMEKNYNQDLKLENIAKILNYNSAYLGKIFKKETGESFNNVYNKIRIQNAKRLLLETDLKIYQVSQQVGYSNIDYFYSKFKKYVGISPKEFKHKD
jgi:two-component system response regulator YesN